MLKRSFSRDFRPKTLIFLLLLHILKHSLCFTQTGNFIHDLESTIESKFIQEVNSWFSSVTSVPSSKYYNCAGDFILGVYSWSPPQSQSGKYLSRQYTDLPTHQVIKYSFSVWGLDSWDWVPGENDRFQIQFDTLPIINGFGVQYQFGSSLCGLTLYKDFPNVRVVGTIAHSSLSLTLKFIGQLNGGTTDESFGIRDISLVFSNDNPGADSICAYSVTAVTLYGITICTCEPGKYFSGSGCAGCSQECATCDGPGVDKCIDCADGYSFDGVRCSKCDSSCTHCTGPEFNQCTECPSGFVVFNGVCITASRCALSPFVRDYDPDVCYSPCSLGVYNAWGEDCYPPCPNSGISDLNGICKTCKSLSVQYLRATNDGHQYTFQLSPSSCDLTIENVRRYLSLTEHTVGSVGSFSFQVTKTSANHYFINLVLDDSVLEDTSLDMKLSYLTGSLNVPKKFVLDSTLKAIAAAIPKVKTGFAGVMGSSFVGLLALGATAGLWSIVSFQQFVGYFLFINVEYPPVVELFLSMLQVSFWDILPNPLAALTGSLSANIIATDKTSVTSYDLSSKFVKYEMNSFFIENGGAIIAVNILLLILLAKILLLKRIKALHSNTILVLLKVYIKWNLVARTFLENGIPLSLAIFLQLRIAVFGRSYLIICFVFAVLSLLYIFIFVFFFWRVLLQRDNDHLRKKRVKRMFGTLYEGITLSTTFSKYYYVIILLRGILLMCLITFLEASPVLQIFPLILFNASLVIYMFKQVCFENKKFDFIAKLKEILILIGEILTLFLCFKSGSETYYTIIGYLIVLFLGLALIAEVGYMIILQICEIRQIGRKFKAGWNWMMKMLKSSKEKNPVEKIKMKSNHRLKTQDLSQSSSELIITRLP